MNGGTGTEVEMVESSSSSRFLAESELESPPQKKPKLDEEPEPEPEPEGKKEEEEEEDVKSVSSDTTYSNNMSFSGDSQPLDPKFLECESDPSSDDSGYVTSSHQKKDKALWERYNKQIKESQGFDITDYPGHCMMATIAPMPFYLEDPKNVKLLKGYSEKALKLYNGNYGTNYEVKDVLKVNGGGCREFNYYITFSVRTADGGDEIFQAMVVEDLDYSLEFPIIRPKGRRDLEMKSGTSCCGGH